VGNVQFVPRCRIWKSRNLWVGLMFIQIFSQMHVTEWWSRHRWNVHSLVSLDCKW
jgi:hypothetical protein